MRNRSYRSLRILALLSALAVAACDDSDEAAEQSAPEAPVVSVAGVTTRDIVQTSKFIGVAEPVDDVALIARVEGFLEEVLVKDGSEVTAYQPLFKIEREKFDAAEARAAAGVAQAEANLALAEIELERDTRLLASDTISQSRFDATQANRDAELAIVQSNKADLEQAKLDVTYTQINAPFEGRIGKIDYSIGDLVGPGGKALATLIRVSPIYVSFSISEADYVDAIKRLGEDAAKQLNRENSPPVRIN
ncbi:MAG: efflux RND transporter periplasmic adaptor subunit, partial [Pseudomonadota bacterium]